MTGAKTISFVIPVYRNERAVTLTYQKIKGALASDLSSYAYEFVFVDDGSDDGSLEELVHLHESDPHVRVISFTRNFGQMAAILAGLKGATGDLILHLSADLQDPVELIPRMVRDYEGGAGPMDVAADVADLLPYHPDLVSPAPRRRLRLCADGEARRRLVQQHRGPQPLFPGRLAVDGL